MRRERRLNKKGILLTWFASGSSSSAEHGCGAIPTTNKLSSHSFPRNYRGSCVSWRMEWQKEEVYFGERIGTKEVYQFAERAFYDRCLQKNSTDSDSTGLRIYAGAQVFIRFMARFPEIFENKKIIELGCGIGAVGLCCCLLSSPQSILLTDGNESAMSMVEKNINEFQVSQIARCQQLLWSLTEGAESHQFDVVIGCELMYYQLDMPLLLATVHNLLQDPSMGIFLHAHIFRKDGQENELFALLHERDWKTLDIPIPSIVSEKEIAEHADWTNVRCLLSGPSQRIQEFQEKYCDWELFTGERVVEDEDPLSALDLF
jgi:predicted nicotinamide N-methyase